METKTCTKCGIEKDRKKHFYRNAAYKDGYYTQCIQCRKELPSQVPDKALKKAYRMRDRNHAHVYDYLRENPCVDCGEDDIVVLEFDHVRGEKFKNLGQMIHSTYSLTRIDAEIAKCDVVCANCHRRRTAKTQAWDKGLSLCP